LLTDEGLRVLLASRHFAARLTGLKRLDLGYNAITDEGIRSLERFGRIEALCELDLSHNQIRGACLRDSASSRTLGELRHLALNNNQLTNYHSVEPRFAGLWQSLGELGKLERLQIGSTGATDDGLSDLASGAVAGHLTHLYIDGNLSGPEGIQTLARSASSLRILSANSVFREFPDTCVAAVASSPHVGVLRSLSLRHNHISNAGAAFLSGSNLKLRALDLRDNDFGDAGVLDLLSYSGVSSLATLYLSANGIHDKGADALARCPYLDGLLELRLGNNQIGSAAKYALQKRFGHRVIFDS
jgi:Leucine-rich repeat (LRR) protein